MWCIQWPLIFFLPPLACYLWLVLTYETALWSSSVVVVVVICCRGKFWSQVGRRFSRGRCVSVDRSSWCRWRCICWLWSMCLPLQLLPSPCGCVLSLESCLSRTGKGDQLPVIVRLVLASRLGEWTSCGLSWCSRSEVCHHSPLSCCRIWQLSNCHRHPHNPWLEWVFVENEKELSNWIKQSTQWIEVKKIYILFSHVVTQKNIATFWFFPIFVRLFLCVLQSGNQTGCKGEPPILKKPVKVRGGETWNFPVWTNLDNSHFRFWCYGRFWIFFISPERKVVDRDVDFTSVFRRVYLYQTDQGLKSLWCRVRVRVGLW